MSTFHLGLIEELAVPYDGTSVANRLRKRRRRLISRLVSFGITCLILGGFYLYQRSQQDQVSVVPLYPILLGLSLVWVAVALLRFLRARTEQRQLPAGIAVWIGRPGVQVAGLAAPWSEVASLRTVRGKVGRGPQLRLSTTTGQPADVPMNQIDVKPATLDSTARAYSGGRHGVDLTALDN